MVLHQLQHDSVRAFHLLGLATGAGWPYHQQQRFVHLRPPVHMVHAVNSPAMCIAYMACMVIVGIVQLTVTMHSLLCRSRKTLHMTSVKSRVTWCPLVVTCCHLVVQSPAINHEWLACLHLLIEACCVVLDKLGCPAFSGRRV